MNSDLLLQYIQELNKPDAVFARKSEDFYDGKQLPHMVARLSDANIGRKNWKQRGFVPMFRNVTKMVSDKSGLIYINGLPEMEIHNANQAGIDEVATEVFAEYIDDTDFPEFLLNIDPLVRILKTVGIMTQYDSATDKFSYDLLHRGNAIFEKEPGQDKLSMVIHRFDIDDKTDGYRVWLYDTVEEWAYAPTVGGGSKPIKINEYENPYGIVPVSLYHDTNVPRVSTLNPIQKDLVNLNEEYNLFLTDLLWSMAYSMRKTLFTNMALGEDDFENTGALSETWTDKFPRSGIAQDTTTFGPDAAVYVDSTGVDSPFLEYRGPDIDLNQINDLFHNMIQDFAYDWSVRIRIEGYGSVNSGFQLIVEEIPNTELRLHRQRMAERALRRVYNVMQGILVSVNPGNAFDPTDELFVTFAQPNIPVDITSEDALWIKRIENGLATKADYFMAVWDMSKEDADLKVKEIDENKTVINKTEQIINE